MSRDESFELIRLARSRVGGKSGFEITSYGEIGEPTNGALLIQMAARIEDLEFNQDLSDGFEPS